MSAPQIDTAINDIPPAFQQAVWQINHSLLPTCIIGGNDQLVACNQGLAKLISLNSLGMPLKDLGEAVWGTILNAMPKVRAGAPELIHEAEINHRYFSISLSPLQLVDGSIGGAILTFIETTATHIAERNLHAIIQHAPVAMSAFRGKNLVVEAANLKVCEMWGKTYAECIGQPIFDIIPEVLNQGFEELADRVLEKGESIEISEMPVMKMHEGQVQQRYMSFSYEPLKNAEGHIDGMVTVGLDVTDSVHLKKMFTLAEERTRIAVEAAAIGIFELKISTDEIVTSPRFDEIFGVRASGLHQDYFKVIHPEDLEEWKNTVQQALETGRLYQQYRVLKTDGTIVWVQMLGSVFYDESDQPERVLGTAIDITLQIQAKLELLDEQKHAQLLLNSIPTIAWTNGPDGEVTFYNQRWYDYTGLSFEETKAWGWREVIHPDDLQHNLNAYGKILSTRAGGTFEVREKRKDGIYRWHLINIEPITDAAGNIVQWIGTATDIQRLKELEQKKDEFLSIASHELKTPLTSIKAFNQLMQRAPDPKRMNGYVHKSADHIQRLEKLIYDLLDVTRINAGKATYDMQSFDFDELIRDTLDSVQMNSDGHELVLERSDAVNFIGDRPRLEQVMTNFLNNAVKYSPKGGKILVNSKIINDGLVISIQDFGIGIAEDHLDKLFDRYYRVDNTAMRFEGLGLGLYISAEILKRHGGTFWIESELGEGSTFYFRLPFGSARSEKTVVDDDIYYRDQTITIIYNQEKSRLDVNWTGFQDVISVKRGGARMLRMLAHNKVSKVFNDNRAVLGNWSEAADWAGKEWFPAMETAGLRYFAWIFSESVFAKLSAEKSVEVKEDQVVTQFFTDGDAADEWLSKC